MKRIHPCKAALVIALCAIFTLAGSLAYARSGGVGSFTEVTGDYRGMSPANVGSFNEMEPGQVATREDGPGVDALTFYTSRGDFDADCGGGVLVDEDFEGTTAGPASIQICGPTLECVAGCTPLWPPGSVICDFELSTLTNLVNLTANSLPGVTSSIVGPNTFAENMVLDLTGADPVFAVGFEIVDTQLFGAGQWTIEVFEGATSLGSTSAGYGFFGVTSDAEAITSITFTGQAPLFFDGELIDNLTFGTCEPGGGPGGPCNLEPIEAKLDVLEPKVDDLAVEVDNLTVDVSTILTDVASLEAKLDAGTGAPDVCDVVRLLTSPELPGAPALPTTHPCFVPTLR